MAKRPVRYDANLPRNLTYRKRDRLYSWRNPVTGQEISLGRIDRKDAVARAIEANNYIDQNYLPSSLGSHKRRAHFHSGRMAGALRGNSRTA